MIHLKEAILKANSAAVAVMSVREKGSESTDTKLLNIYITDSVHSISSRAGAASQPDSPMGLGAACEAPARTCPRAGMARTADCSHQTGDHACTKSPVLKHLLISPEPYQTASSYIYLALL